MNKLVKNTMSVLKAFFVGTKKVYSTIITVVVLIFMVLMLLKWTGFNVDNPINKAAQKVEQAAMSDQDKIAIVKEGKLYNTDSTIGQVFDTMFSEPNWKYFKSEGKDIVEFNGMYCSQDTNYSLMTQFLLSGDEKDSFQLVFMNVDGRSLSDEQKKTLLDSIYNEYQTIQSNK